MSAHKPRINHATPGVEGYFPLNEPKIGTPDFPKDLIKNEHVPKLFTPITIRGMEFKNRIFVSPMCQYSSPDGFLTDWHLVHLGSFAVRGAAGIMIEATAVSPEGRISPEDAGLWKDEHVAPIKRIANFVHSQGARLGIQLAHAGRKASTYPPWVSSDILLQSKDGDDNRTAREGEEGGWPEDVWGPSEVRYKDTWPMPKALSVEGIQDIKGKWVDAARRAEAVDLDFIELHFAHGYLVNNFLSPISNIRTDAYGGSFENRIRFALEIAKAVREVWKGKPLFVRLSATEWAEQGEKDEEGNWVSWGLEQTVLLVRELVAVGVDFIDASSGLNLANQKVTGVGAYQVPFAEALKKDSEKNVVGAVGLIVTPQHAEEILQKGQADVVFLARELLRHVDWPLYAAQELGVVVKPPVQYQRGWAKMVFAEKLREKN